MEVATGEGSLVIMAGIPKKVHQYCNDLIECDPLLDGMIWDLRQLSCSSAPSIDAEVDLELNDDIESTGDEGER